MDSKTDQYQENNMEALLEWLKSLRITKENTLNETTKTETIDAMSIVSALAVQNKQAVMPKNIVPDSEWFDRNRMKFEN